MNKQMLYREAQEWPRPPEYHHRPPGIYERWGKTDKYQKRRKERKRQHFGIAEAVDETRSCHEMNYLVSGKEEELCPQCRLERAYEHDKEDDFDGSECWIYRDDGYGIALWPRNTASGIYIEDCEDERLLWWALDALVQVEGPPCDAVEADEETLDDEPASRDGSISDENFGTEREVRDYMERK